jgi:hypothetical protein
MCMEEIVLLWWLMGTHVNIGGYVICPCGMVTILQGGSNKNQQLFILYDMIYIDVIREFVCIYHMYVYMILMYIGS